MRVLTVEAAKVCCVAMHVCPTCGKQIKHNQSIASQGGMVVYHATCWFRRVVQ